MKVKKGGRNKLIPFQEPRKRAHISKSLQNSLFSRINEAGLERVLHILDDFFIALPPPHSLCSTELDIPLASGKTFGLSTELEFMGILLDSQRMEAWLPEDKLSCPH